MCERHPLVLAAVGKQQRFSNTPSLLKRRRGLELQRVFFLVTYQNRHAVAQERLCHVRRLVPAGGVHQADVGDAQPFESALVQFRIIDQSHQGCIAAIAGAGNADAARIGVALGNGPAGAVGNIVLHGQAPLPHTRFKMARTKPEAAAKLHFQHGIAARGKKLGVGIPAPARAPDPGSAVHQHHHRQILAVGTGRQGQEARNVQAIACLEADRFLPAHLRGNDAGVSGGDPVEGAGARVIQAVNGRLAVGIGLHQDERRPGARSHIEQIDGAGESFVDGRLQRFHRRIEPDIIFGIRGQAYAQQLVAAHQRPAEIVADRGHHRFGTEFFGGQIEGAQRGQIIPAVGDHVQGPVGPETEGVDFLSPVFEMLEPCHLRPFVVDGAAIKQRALAGRGGQRNARLALRIEPVFIDPGRRLWNLFSRARQRVQAQQASPRIVRFFVEKRPRHVDPL